MHSSDRNKTDRHKRKFCSCQKVQQKDGTYGNWLAKTWIFVNYDTPRLIWTTCLKVPENRTHLASPYTSRYTPSVQNCMQGHAAVLQCFLLRPTRQGNASRWLQKINPRLFQPVLLRRPDQAYRPQRPADPFRCNPGSFPLVALHRDRLNSPASHALPEWTCLCRHFPANALYWLISQLRRRLLHGMPHRIYHKFPCHFSNRRKKTYLQRRRLHRHNWSSAKRRQQLQVQTM